MDRDLLIKEKTRDIIGFLGFYDKKTSGTELENIIKTYKYVVQNINSNLNYREQPNSFGAKTNYENALLTALTNNPGLPTTNCILFQHLLSGIDVDSHLVLCKSNSSGEPHIANLVRIKKEYYYFDPTLERMISDEKSMEADKLLMLCAAMGKNDYEKLYTPVQILKRPGKRSRDGFPKNIADESIAKVIINAINLKFPHTLKREIQKDMDDNSKELELD